VRFYISRRVVLGEHLNDGGVIIAGMIRCAWGQERHNATQGKDGDGQDRHAGLCDHHDGKAGHETLPDDPGEVFAEAAYCGAHFS